AALLIATGSPSLLACDEGTAVPDPNDNPGLVADCKVLLAFHDELAGHTTLNWSSGLAITHWEGIGVSGSPSRVSALNLEQHRLTGKMPAALSQLSGLRTLHLGENRLAGEIPESLGQLPLLQTLNLSSNRLTGAIPEGLGRLSSLEILSLFRNQLTGRIPSELGQLSNLKSLSLSDNRLTGGIPEGLGRLSSLEILFLSRNQLAGRIPSELGQLSNLEWLSLRFNQLTEEIPAALGRLSKLEYLYLNGNDLTGEIPPELSQLSRLEGLYLDHNRLTGEIPETLGNLSGLNFLFLNNNRLTGEIPSTLGQLSRLSLLHLHQNRLTGPIPTFWVQTPYVRELSLSANQLTGEIPPSLRQMIYLERLSLDNNRLTGSIPPELGKLERLEILHLQHNQLTGPIPAELGQLPRLEEFSVQGNRLSEPFPGRLNGLPLHYVLNLTATRSGADRMTVIWDDPLDPNVHYWYRLQDENRIWTRWTLVESPETMLRKGEGVTIELTLTGLPTDTVYRQIEVSLGTPQYLIHLSWISSVRNLVPLAASEPVPERSLFVPVILSAAGRFQSFYTSELTLTNRGSRETRLDFEFTYTDHYGSNIGKLHEYLEPGRQLIVPDAIEFLSERGVPMPAQRNRLGTLRVEFVGSSEVSAMARTTTEVPDGRAGLAYPGIAEGEGFEEAVYLCGLRQNEQDRSNVAIQNMGAVEEGEIVLRTTVFSGDPAAPARSVVLPDLITLPPGGFHQYDAILKAAGFENGYVKVERVEGRAPFYAYGVINDNFNSDGSFVFPVTESSLVGTRGQTLPVIIENRGFTSELTVTNFSPVAKSVDFQFVADAVKADGEVAGFSLRLEPGEQRILPRVVDWLRQQEVGGIGPAGPEFVGALLATPAEGDMSGVVIGARTGSPDERGGQYSLFYNAVPYGSASVESAWIYGLQQNAENRSNLALVNTGEIDDSSSTFEITIYDGSGESRPRTRSVTLGPRRWTQKNGILGSIGQGYLQVRKTSGNNPFVAYGVINDGGSPGERSGDGAFLPSQE
ncbi:MAG: hypothetical protein OXH11_15835, partial [Candidatus Aminicenantes bacterium]|nr:hypothetical protein [Candidatus Aminicenantes bacterium]